MDKARELDDIRHRQIDDDNTHRRELGFWVTDIESVNDYDLIGSSES